MKITRRGFLKLLGVGGPGLAATATAKMNPVKGLEALFRNLPQAKGIRDGQVILGFDPKVMYGDWMKSGIIVKPEMYGVYGPWRPSPKPGKKPGDLGYYDLSQVPDETMRKVRKSIETFIPRKWRPHVVIDLSASGDIIWWRYLPPGMSPIRNQKPPVDTFFPEKRKSKLTGKPLREGERISYWDD